MDSLVKILIVEDEMLIGANISMLLTNLGYEVTGIIPRGEAVLRHVEDNPPDIILLDINLKGKLDGIETAKALQQYDIPIIYVTANSDNETFKRAKETRPAAFITKPFHELELERAIELTISRMAERHNTTTVSAKEAEQPEEEQFFFLSDRIFIRHNGKMVKLLLVDILYIEAERNYSRLITRQKNYLVSFNLKNIEERLTIPYLVRIHRSFLVNLNHIDEVLEANVMVGNNALPLGSGMREELMRRMQTL